jgi:biopolymer transport protein ExbD
MKARARATHTDTTHLGFQVAPMIDVVFVIMLFFMVMAGAIKAERQIVSALPTYAGAEGLPDELVIVIDEDGYISLNEEEVAIGSDRKLGKLHEWLAYVHRDAVARGSQPIVTIQSEAHTRYQRIVDVLNLLSKLGLTNVTFTVGEEE